MTEISALFGKPQKVKVKLLNGERILEFPILNVEQMAPFMEAKKTEEDQFKSVKKLAWFVLERSFPDAKRSDIDKLSIGDLMTIVSKLLEINGIEVKGKNTPLLKSKEDLEEK